MANLQQSLLARARTELHTSACDILGCDVPVALAGMGGVARAELVTAVSEAGGYGFLGMVRESPRFMRKQIQAVRAGTQRDFGVNIIPAATPSDLFKEQLLVCIEEKIHSICLFWELDRDTVSKLRDNGIFVVCQVGSAKEAEQALAAGAQMLIAQGIEAGGHVRGTVARSKLLAEALALAGDVPVLSAGGMARGRDLADALDQGASGVVMGTAFLATQESFAHDYHKQRIVEGSSKDTVHTQDFHINWPRGAFVRVLQNSVTTGQYGDPFAPEHEAIGEDYGRTLYRFSTDSPLRTTTGELEQMALYAGLGAGEINDIPTAAERMDAILSEALEQRADMPKQPSSEDAESDVKFASPSCTAATADDGYMGYLTLEEITTFLNTLLEAERAGARAAARLALDSLDEAGKVAMKKLHTNEVFCCRLLLDELSLLGATPSPRVGDFYGKLMAIPSHTERVIFLAKGQRWVARKLEENLPKIRSAHLHSRLTEMLSLHKV